MYSRHPDANSIFALATGFLDLHMKSAGDRDVTQFSNYLLTLQLILISNKQTIANIFEFNVTKRLLLKEISYVFLL